MAKEHAMIESGRRQSLGKRIWKNRWVYLFLLPGIAFVLLFCYGPMYGLVVAFKDYKISKGILGSPWANPWYNNFAMMFKDKKFNAAFFNTIRMGLAYIITGFPGPIILALLLNELRSRHYKNTLQVIYTFPNFLSWVIVGGLMTTIFAGEGVINSLIRASGGQTYGFLTDKSLIRPLLYATSSLEGNWLVSHPVSGGHRGHQPGTLRSRRGGRREPLPQDVVHHMAGNPLDGGDSAHSGVRRHHEQGL